MKQCDLYVWMFFLVGRRQGKAVIFVENIVHKKHQFDVVICEEGEDDEQKDMETGVPKLKKSKLWEILIRFQFIKKTIIQNSKIHQKMKCD